MGPIRNTTQHLKTRLSYLLVAAAVAASCERMPTGGFFFPRGGSDQPVTTILKTGEGYRVNPVTGDSIRPLITPSGDTAVTGIPVPAHGEVVDPDSLEQPREIPAEPSSVVPLRQQLFPIPEELDPVPVSFTSIEMSPGMEQAGFPGILVNSVGDTVPTGAPVTAAGKEKPYSPGYTVFALPPGMKDYATFDIKFLDVYHGLPSSQVVSMLEDRFGRIWLGTGGGGASIYDGQGFTNLTREEGLCESMILTMLEDSRGNIWFGSNGEGLIMFDGDKFTHYTDQNGLSNNTINDLYEDRSGNIWFTQGGGICRYSGGSFTHYSMNEGLLSRGILAIREDSRGTLWLGTQEGIIRYDGETFQRMDGIPRVAVRDILEEKDGTMWFATSNRGLIRMRDSLITWLGTAQGLSNDQVESLFQDSRGILWAGTAGGGVNMFDGHAFTHFTEENGLSGQWIIPIMEDNSENLWFGSMGGGVSIFNRRSFRHFTEKEGLSIRAVFSMLEDSRENLWFGSLFGSVTRFDGNTFEHYLIRNGPGEPTVESMMEDREGNIWFGLGSRGISKFNGRTFTNYGRRTGFTFAPVGSMLEDREGILWFGTLGGGLISYDGKTFTHYTERGGLVNNYVESLLKDREGNIWIGFLGGGLCRFDGRSFTNYTEKEGLSSNHIGTLFEDGQGRLWLGTMDRGVMIISGDSITCLTERQGLSDNFVQSVAEDKYGNIWLSTDNGLNLIRAGSSAGSFQIETFGLQEGLKGINFFQNSVLLDSRNRLWWGNSKSLTMLNLNTFDLSGDPPGIQIDRVDLNRRMADFRQWDPSRSEIRFDSVVPYFNVPVNLQLPYSQNHLTFHFLGIDWSAPWKIRFSFKLEGVDEDWSVSRSQPFAEYRNLPYGEHTFKVRAMGNSQTWSEPVSFSFSVLRPWWNTWPARVGMLLAAVLIVVLIVRWRTSILKRRQRELEKIVSDRTEEVSEMNEELRQQNVSLAAQRDEIQAQKDRIELQNQAIKDSIEYARRIQTATLPPDEVLRYLLPKHFILHKPLDIVSGDFYWLTQKQGMIILAVADCTGHGVPGAFMSMLGSALLNEVAGTIPELQPGLILDELRDQVIRSLRQTGATDEARDGMDISLCLLDMEHMKLRYAGAHQPLYHVRGGKLTEIKGDPMPIGISSEAGKPFTSHEMSIAKGDTIYLFSDGYVDQLGGERRKRFMTSRFKKLLLELQDQIMHDQKQVLENRIKEWMGQTGSPGRKVEQIDDILVMGIKF